ncbi:MAG: mRNA surveillance protein pelota [Candidatus Aenigmarchaeota archaeon]|nr:mRNA surveillance protein pelota [Candidatus Aenigmarchaeota archaeon]
MRIIAKDFKKETKIKPETIDDLWNLSLIIAAGDAVGAKTLRTVETSDKKEKRPMYLKISVESIEFDDITESLRIKGKILEGPDDISFGYHSFRIFPNDIISVSKQWKRYEIERLEKSTKSISIKILTIVLDERKADFGEVMNSKVNMLGTIKAENQGKMFGTHESKSYYADIIKSLEQYSKRYDKIIIAGPGFTKENIMKLAQKSSALKGKCVPGISSVTGETGVYEVIKRGFIDQIAKTSEISRETKEIERFMEALGKESNLVTYGIKEVAKAAKAGAVEKILVSDSIVKKEEVQDILKFVENSSGKVEVIGSTHEAGEKLTGLGGVICFLRYGID